MAEKDRLVRAAGPVDKADQPLPHPPVGRVGLGLQMNLDRSIPDLGSLGEEGINGDLIELINAAILNSLIGSLDESLNALDEQDQQRLLPGVGKGAKVGRCCQITGPQVLGPSGQLQPGRDLGRMFPRGNLLGLSLFILEIPLEGLLDLGADKLGRGQRLCLLGPLDLRTRGDGEEATACGRRKEPLTAHRLSPVESFELLGAGGRALTASRSAQFRMGLPDMFGKGSRSSDDIAAPRALIPGVYRQVWDRRALSIGVDAGLSGRVQPGQF